MKKPAVLAAALPRLPLSLRVGVAIAGCVLGAPLLLLYEPPVRMAVLSALAAYFMRLRVLDAALIGVGVLVGDQVEADVGAGAFTCLALPLLLLTRRTWFCTAVAASALGVVVGATYLKGRFAGTPLTWQDVHFFFLRFRDNVGVMATEPTLLTCAGAILGGAGAMCWLAWRLDRDGRMRSPWLAAPGAVAAAAAIACGAHQVSDGAAALRHRGAWAMLAASKPLQHPLSGLLATVAVRPTWQPRDIDTSSFARASRQIETTAAPAGAPADIVVFLQESQFNPATLAGCPADLCRVPIFDGGPRVVAQGPFRVHVFGGGTWLSEFSFETGVPHTAFGAAGDFAPFTVAPGVRQSFVRSLKAAGYRTVALYPTAGGMMNGRAAYAGYGFDAFYDAGELGLSGSFRTPDEQMHAAVRKVLAQERRQGKPVFVMALTIFNHAEHGVRLGSVPSELLREAHDAFADPREADDVADYVWRTRLFQQAMTKTSDAVLDAGRPAVLAWFGDHQPPFGNAVSLRARVRAADGTPARMAPRYQTWYQVRSNIGSAAAGGRMRALDLVFLPGVLAQAARVPLDDWLAANVDAREACDGLFDECRRPEQREAYLSYLHRDLDEFDLP